MTQIALPLEVRSSAPGELSTASHWTYAVRRLAEVRGDDQGFLQSTGLELPICKGPDLRVVDLFSGCGGISLGLREAAIAAGHRFRPVLAVDSHAQALETYRRNFAPENALTDPIEKLLDARVGASLSAVERDLRRQVKQVDMVCGGPPCQGHSDLNNFARRQDKKNALYWLMARAVEVFEPKYVLVENVLGALHDRSGVVQSTCLRLSKLGYSVSLGIVDVVKLGVPQRRRRLLLLASREGVVPEVSELDNAVSLPMRTVDWAIRDLEYQRETSLLDMIAAPNETTRGRIDYLFDNDLYELPNEQRPACHRDKEHTYNSIYGRLRWDAPAQTITRGFYCMCMGRYVHPSRRRTLSAHEAARLQFFPDSFDFTAIKNRTALAELIGNAVPMKLSYVAGIALLRPVEG